jgi:hypothetical protein
MPEQLLPDSVGEGDMSEERVTWPRVKELLDDIMERWIARHGEPALGIHDYWWDTPQELANNKPYGRQLIEPGQPGSETQLVVFLRRGIGTIPRMPRGGPFLSEAKIQEIESWIDAGMPES